jgi:hypothetical protein
MEDFFTNLFHQFPLIRYIAVYQHHSILSRQREDIQESSSSNSDLYEELLVNPTLLTLTKQRGNIDCGGLRYIIIAYGNFYQFVQEINAGHLSICMDKSAQPSKMVAAIRSFIELNHPELVINGI